MPSANNKTHPRMLKAAEKRSLAVKLKNSGVSAKEISEQLGVSVTQINKYLNKAYDDWHAATIGNMDQMIAREAMILENITVNLTTSAQNGSVAANRELRQTRESYRKLYGLDAPMKIAPTDKEGNDIDGLANVILGVQNRINHGNS
jgi:predicted transcriptional regulator